MEVELKIWGKKEETQRERERTEREGRKMEGEEDNPDSMWL